jgi:hypothetical protein
MGAAWWPRPEGPTEEARSSHASTHTPRHTHTHSHTTTHTRLPLTHSHTQPPHAAEAHDISRVRLPCAPRLQHAPAPALAPASRIERASPCSSEHQSHSSRPPAPAPTLIPASNPATAPALTVALVEAPRWRATHRTVHNEGVVYLVNRLCCLLRDHGLFDGSINTLNPEHRSLIILPLHCHAYLRIL